MKKLFQFLFVVSFLQWSSEEKLRINWNRDTNLRTIWLTIHWRLKYHATRVVDMSYSLPVSVIDRSLRLTQSSCERKPQAFRLFENWTRGENPEKPSWCEAGESVYSETCLSVSDRTTQYLSLVRPVWTATHFRYIGVPYSPIITNTSCRTACLSAWCLSLFKSSIDALHLCSVQNRAHLMIFIRPYQFSVRIVWISAAMIRSTL